ncbi:hypothetical protein Agub_g10839, partial [Astrephomene gubernaculifera]
MLGETAERDQPVNGASEPHFPIVFSLQQDQSEQNQSVLDEEREKHKRRAQRFGTEYHDPGRVRRDFGLMMEARRERLVRPDHRFTTGDLDLFSQEEQAKRAARAARFQLSAPLAPSVDAYRPDEELQARARRAAKFGVPYQPTDAVLMDMDLYEQRREVGSDVERRPNAIYLYGVDVMSTKEVLSYFTEYGPVFVEWLDDSSCNVLFSDANSAKRALVGKGTPLPPNVITSTSATAQQPQQQQQGEAGLAAAAAQESMTDAAMAATAREGEAAQPGEAGTAAGEAAAGAGGGGGTTVRYQPELPVPDNLADVANLPYIWHKGRDFIKDGTPISLVFRMATAADVRDMHQPKRTRRLWTAAGG